MGDPRRPRPRANGHLHRQGRTSERRLRQASPRNPRQPRLRRGRRRQRRHHPLRRRRPANRHHQRRRRQNFRRLPRPPRNERTRQRLPPHRSNRRTHRLPVPRPSHHRSLVIWLLPSSLPSSWTARHGEAWRVGRRRRTDEQRRRAEKRSWPPSLPCPLPLPRKENKNPLRFLRRLFFPPQQQQKKSHSNKPDVDGVAHKTDMYRTSKARFSSHIHSTDCCASSPDVGRHRRLVTTTCTSTLPFLWSVWSGLVWSAWCGVAHNNIHPRHPLPSLSIPEGGQVTHRGHRGRRGTTNTAVKTAGRGGGPVDLGGA
mmetsp:Transcript_11544/g.37949  ORF Transcript_11544/g.37949 Transcript_11544/m.37949 type:complete len:313 (-) Transcript_11544:65-1003(-)